MRRILLVLALIAPTLALGVPARAGDAGGWAATYLDPVPAAFQPDATYTIGHWLLQHGNHPYSGTNLGKVGLKFTAGTRTLEFTAVELKERAHYATAVALPKGTWRVEAIQGWFQPVELGTLSVPGALKIAPLPPQTTSTIPRFLEMNGGKDPWGAIRPSGFPRKGAASGTAAAPAAAEPLTGAATVAVVESETPWWRTTAAVVAAALVLAALALAPWPQRRSSGETVRW